MEMKNIIIIYNDSSVLKAVHNVDKFDMVCLLSFEDCGDELKELLKKQTDGFSWV
jgi:hypothetical protein